MGEPGNKATAKPYLLIFFVVVTVKEQRKTWHLYRMALLYHVMMRGRITYTYSYIAASMLQVVDSVLAASTCARHGRLCRQPVH